MDIHAPHEPVHTWRDFLTHLTIVTIGLFIALMLEAGVEYLHHRHIVREARENIRREIESNHKEAVENLSYIDTNMQHVNENIKTLMRMQDTHEKHGSLNNTMVYSSFDEAAWLTARETGALSFMPYDEVQEYSGIYSSQATVNKRAEEIAQDEFKSLSPFLTVDSKKDLSPAQYGAVLQNNADVLVDLCTLSQFIESLDSSYTKQLGLPQTKQTTCANLK